MSGESQRANAYPGGSRGGDESGLPERVVAAIRYEELGRVGDYLLYCRDRDMSANTIVAKHTVLLRVDAELHPNGLIDAEEPALRDWWRRLARRRLAGSTRGVYLSHVRAFYKWAMREDLRGDDPTRRIDRPQRRRGQPRPLDPGPVGELLDRLDGQAWYAVALAAGAGLRCAEICRVTGADLHSDAAAGAHYLRVVGKGAKVRNAPISADLVTALAAHGPGFLFTNRYGRPWTPGYMSRFLALTLRGAGVDGTAHQLRHTYGTLLYRRSHDLLGVQKALGHASPETTGGYAQADVTELAPHLNGLYPRRKDPDP